MKKNKSGRQAPKEVWTPEKLKQALYNATIDEKVEMLTEIGILDKNGELSSKYKSWNRLISRTSNYIK